MACEQELCPFWAGEGCVCALLGVDEDERNERRKRWIEE